MITATCLENKSYGQAGVRWQLGTPPTEKGAGWVSGAEGHSSWSAASKQDRGEPQEKGMSPHAGLVGQAEEPADPHLHRDSSSAKAPNSWQTRIFSVARESLQYDHFLNIPLPTVLVPLLTDQQPQTLTNISKELDFQAILFAKCTYVHHINVVSFPVHMVLSLLMCSSLKL